MAGLLKYLDTNNNMKIFEQTTSDDWRHKLWLEMFKETSATVVQYRDLLHGENETLPEEFMVQMTSCTGQVMFAQLPFSWVIKATIDNFIAQDFQRTYKFVKLSSYGATGTM